MRVSKNTEGGISRRVGIPAVAAAGVLVVGAALFTSGPASAEPYAPTAQYVAVGSDTLESAVDVLSNGSAWTGTTTQIKTTSGTTVANYGAFGSNWIQTRLNVKPIVRPAGSGAGRSALAAAQVAGPLAGTVDIARSSSGWSNPTGTDGRWFEFGKDAVSYAYVAGSAGAGTAIANLTTAQLTAIYNGTSTVVGGTTVKPLLPQASSGTRSFFLKAIGNPVLSAGVQQGFPENDGSIFAGLPALTGTQAYIIPFSAAQWIAQNNGLAGNTTSGVTLGKTNSVAPFTGTAPSLVPNATYYNGTFGRVTYLVVAAAKYTADAQLQSLFNPANINGFFSANATTVKQKFGFLAPTSTVGTIHGIV